VSREGWAISVIVTRTQNPRFSVTLNTIASVVDSESFFTHKNQVQKGINADTGIMALKSGLLISLDTQKKSILSSNNAGEEWSEIFKLDTSIFQQINAVNGFVVATTLDGRFFEVSEFSASIIDPLTGYESAIAIGESVYLASKGGKLFRFENGLGKDIGKAPTGIFASRCTIFEMTRLACGRSGEVYETDLSQQDIRWQKSDQWAIFFGQNGLINIDNVSIHIETSSGVTKSLSLPTNHLTVRDAFLDAKQRLWLLSSSNGLQVFDGKEWVSFGNQTSLAIDSAFSKFIDNGSRLLGIFDRKVLFKFIDHSNFSEIAFDSPNTESCERLAVLTSAISVSCMGVDGNRRVLLLDQNGLRNTEALSAEDPAALFQGDKNLGFIVGTDDGFMKINSDMSLEKIQSLGKYSSRSKFGRLNDDSVAVTDNSLISVFNGTKELKIFTTSKISEFIRNVLDLNEMPQTLNIETIEALEDQDNLTKPSISPKGEAFVGGRGGYFTIKPSEVTFTKAGDASDQVLCLLKNDVILTNSALKGIANQTLMSFESEVIGGVHGQEQTTILTNSLDGLFMSIIDSEWRLQSQQPLDLVTDETPEATYAGGKLWVVGKNRILIF
jgi:hypothetical protein